MLLCFYDSDCAKYNYRSSGSTLSEAFIRDGNYLTENFTIYVPYITTLNDFRELVRILKTSGPPSVKEFLSEREVC